MAWVWLDYSQDRLPGVAWQDTQWIGLTHGPDTQFGRIPRIATDTIRKAIRQVALTLTLAASLRKLLLESTHGTIKV